MEVAYTTTLDDYVAFCMHMYRKSKAARGSFLLAWLILPAACLATAVAVVYGDGPIGQAAYWAGIAAIWVAVYPWFHRRLVARHVRNFAKGLGVRGVIGPIRLILTDTSVVEITELTRTEARWQDLAGIDVLDDYTFVLITGMSAAIIPRHGFEREADYDRVRDFALARLGRGA